SIPHAAASAPFPYTTLFRSELGRPGGGVGAHHQPPVGEGLRGAVRGHLVADQHRPAAEDALHLEVELPAVAGDEALHRGVEELGDRKSTRLNSSHVKISYAV